MLIGGDVILGADPTRDPARRAQRVKTTSICAAHHAPGAGVKWVASLRAIPAEVQGSR
jgi:hypothetical protein